MWGWMEKIIELLVFAYLFYLMRKSMHQEVRIEYMQEKIDDLSRKNRKLSYDYDWASREIKRIQYDLIVCRSRGESKDNA